MNNNFRNAGWRKRLCWASLMCAALSCQAQTRLPESVAAALRDANIAETSLGALVIPLQGGTPRLAHFDVRPMAPGSTMKLVTTLVALDQLGPTWRWRTQLLSANPVKGSTLRGPLYLRGGGDPNLTWDSLRGMFRSLHAQGVRNIAGDMVLDRSYFQPTRPDLGAAPFDETPNAYYNVIPDALLLGSNIIGLEIDSDSETTQARTTPPLARLSVHIKASLDNSKCEDWDDNWVVSPPQLHTDGSAGLSLSGTYPKNCKTATRLNLIDRNLYIESFIRAFWQELGGRWSGRTIDGVTPPLAQLLVERSSDTLADTVKLINKTSDNAMARSLYLTLGAQYREARNDATWQSAEAAVRSWFTRRAITMDGLILENGSGLSRLERISPRQLAAVLQAGVNSNWFVEFANSLPIVGIDGTMRKRLRDSPSAGRARIKTGTLKDAVAVAGYARDNARQDWIVVAIINDPAAKKGRPALDAIINWVVAETL
jgi:D-alanyl-D-alanine carboxypeptidase/D-alanyl-D-alanine-endopeptidase (penicillin-binding protein 4)